jgi:hypothetical protein
MRSCSESSVGLGHRNVASKFALPSCDVGVLENRAALSCKKCVAISLGHVRKSAPPDLPSPHLSLPKCRLLHSRNSTCTMRLLMGGALACSSLHWASPKCRVSLALRFRSSRQNPDVLSSLAGTTEQGTSGREARWLGHRHTTPSPPRCKEKRPECERYMAR